MIDQILTALIGNYMTTAFVIGTSSSHRSTSSPPRTPHRGFVSGTFLNSFVFWAIGVAETINFVMHSVFGDYAAKTIGWAQSPFQLELAMSSLGIGVMAFILGRRTAPLIGKVALVIARRVFGFGAAGGHIYQMLVNHDYAVNNSGTPARLRHRHQQRRPDPGDLARHGPRGARPTPPTRRSSAASAAHV